MMQIEYVWLDGKNTLRSKTKVMKSDAYLSLDDVPVWNYDGSSTYQAFTEKSEVMLYPMKLYPNPFLDEGEGFIILCKTSYDLCSMSIAEKIFTTDNVQRDVPMFGLEQEFFIMDTDTNRPAGWPMHGNPEPQGDYYCSVGAKNAFGRDYLDECLTLLIEMGINVTGMNFEVAPGQAEFQVCEIGIDAAHALTMVRYILERLGEKHGYYPNYEPKPIKGDWNGSGCHVNFSTQAMRENGGYELIKECMTYLENNHSQDIKLYGKGNEYRLTGKHETSGMDKFTYGVANRGASVRIPTQTEKEGRGYFEDRRPAANIDPYLVTANLYKVCCLDHTSLYEDETVKQILQK